MRKGWEEKKLGDICGFTRGPFGGSLKKSIFKEHGYAVYEQSHAIYNQFDEIRYFIDEDKFNEMKRFELNPGDIIMSCSGTMGKVAIVPANIKRGIINQALLRLAPSKKILTKFLELWMGSEDFQNKIKEYSQGAAIQNVASVSILKEITIPLPSLPEQKQIVCILDQAFATIDKAIENTKKNLQNAKELFESYLQEVLEHVGDRNETSIAEVCEEIFAGGDAPKENFSLEKNKSNTVPIYANAVKDRGLYGYTNFARVTAPSITISARGSGTGHTELRNESYLPIVRLIVLIPKTEIVKLEFLKFKIDNLEILRSGSAIPQLTVPMIKEYKIHLPSIKEQIIIVDKLNNLQTETKKLETIYEQKIADLEELKKSILQKAFNGELITEPIPELV